MDFVTLLSPDRIALHQEVSSTKRAFEVLAELIANDQPYLSTEMIFEAFVNREKLGCTALGNGVAIPHVALSQAHPSAALLYTREGLKMGAPDKKPVHLFLALIVPPYEAKNASYSAMMMEMALTFARHDLTHQLASCSNGEEVIAYLEALLNRPLAA
ncbi:MAG: PTS sugar transporter subunit IIA [Thiofilum sp.]|uniref:PTS sugar transporter subunit IIA n=1 Tax=Thiofilum sp. TaxID=2212733 RepID=UPI0025F86A8F|nr:PTS sugar transporter subunit IIA [Thiofilum sp.]MBK8455210.1 PTS sugar transporter subunit IIA [Thiofilum sp.]